MTSKKFLWGRLSSECKRRFKAFAITASTKCRKLIFNREFSRHRDRLTLLLSIVLYIVYANRTVDANDKAEVNPTLGLWKNFVLRSFITDLEDQAIHFSDAKELTRIALHYEQLEKAFENTRKISASITGVLVNQKFVTCSHVILGTGDTGTTLWLEKYKPYHGKTWTALRQGKTPEVLMIGETFGSWRHDYTLAQPYNLLERGNTVLDPSGYLFHQFYLTNPYANARHVYQANLINLERTEAPCLIGVKIMRVEKKNQHFTDWESEGHDYRLIIRMATTEKAIYANEIDICTGLGPARKSIADKCDTQAEFELLCQFDSKKKFTPVIDGDQFILTDNEEKSPASKIIVVYGGGGTAAACYRKGFFGHDRQKEFGSFENQVSKNTVIWIAKDGFDAAGGGKLATKAIETAKKRNELFIAELYRITRDPNTGKLRLSFALAKKLFQMGVERSLCEIECDQLVYAIGQEDIELKQACEELDAYLELDINKIGTPLGVKSKDEKVHFFGAAAMAIRQKDYMAATWKWLHQENIGPDVGPGSMPPSRAQIRQYASEMGISVEGVNVNMDCSHLIQKFLGLAGVEEKKVPFFIEDILQARKASTSGFSSLTLQMLLDKYGINDKVKILGLCYLIRA